MTLRIRFHCSPLRQLTGKVRELNLINEFLWKKKRNEIKSPTEGLKENLLTISKACELFTENDLNQVRFGDQNGRFHEDASSKIRFQTVWFSEPELNCHMTCIQTKFEVERYFRPLAKTQLVSYQHDRNTKLKGERLPQCLPVLQRRLYTCAKPFCCVVVENFPEVSHRFGRGDYREHKSILEGFDSRLGWWTNKWNSCVLPSHTDVLSCASHDSVMWEMFSSSLPNIYICSFLPLWFFTLCSLCLKPTDANPGTLSHSLCWPIGRPTPIFFQYLLSSPIFYVYDDPRALIQPRAEGSVVVCLEKGDTNKGWESVWLK